MYAIDEPSSGEGLRKWKLDVLVTWCSYFIFDMFTQGKEKREFELMIFVLLGVVDNRLSYHLRITWYSYGEA